MDGIPRTPELRLSRRDLKRAWKQMFPNVIWPTSFLERISELEGEDYLERWREGCQMYVDPDWILQFCATRCLFVKYSPSKKAKNLGCRKDRYAQVRYKGTKYYCHRIAALLVDLGVEYANLLYEGSHYFCSRGGCCNPWHVCLETGYVNKSRWCCDQYGRKEGYFCPHSPPCGNADQTIELPPWNYAQEESDDELPDDYADDDVF